MLRRLLLRAKIIALNVKRRLSGHLNVAIRTYVNIEASSHIQIDKSAKIRATYFSIGKNSTLIVGPDSYIDGYFHIGDNCTVVIGKHFQMRGKPSVIVERNSIVRIADYFLLNNTSHILSVISVVEGKLQLASNVTVGGSLRVSNGSLSIGSDTFVNHGSEVRCENNITIGHHVMISYYVDIFDTNTHSTHWRDRQDEIDQGFPNRTAKTSAKKPYTAPISIGHHVWIGKYAAVLKGTNIGSRSIVGMRTVVTKSCPEDSLVAGNPGKVRAMLNAENAIL